MTYLFTLIFLGISIFLICWSVKNIISIIKNKRDKNNLKGGEK